MLVIGFKAKKVMRQQISYRHIRFANIYVFSKSDIYVTRRLYTQKDRILLSDTQINAYEATHFI